MVRKCACRERQQRLTSAASLRSRERRLTTDPEENTMLNKVVVFVIFGPKCIFDASKTSN